MEWRSAQTRAKLWSSPTAMAKQSPIWTDHSSSFKHLASTLSTRRNDTWKLHGRHPYQGYNSDKVTVICILLGIVVFLVSVFPLLSVDYVLYAGQLAIKTVVSYTYFSNKSYTHMMGVWLNGRRKMFQSEVREATSISPRGFAKQCENRFILSYFIKISFFKKLVGDYCGWNCHRVVRWMALKRCGCRQLRWVVRTWLEQASSRIGCEKKYSQAWELETFCSEMEPQSHADYCSPSLIHQSSWDI